MQTKVTLQQDQVNSQVSLHPNPLLAERGCSANVAYRFWEKVHKTPTCWIWLGSLDKNGYGLLVSRKGSYRQIRAHILSWILHNGKIPDGLCVLHNCPGGDSRCCVNPSHLWLGTRMDNNRDKVVKHHGSRGMTHGAHKLTNQQVQHIREFYAQGTVTQAALGKLYKVRQDNISRIICRKRWVHI